MLDVLEILAKRHSDLKGGGFSHLANAVELEGGSFDAAPGIVLRKAEPNEVASLREFVQLALLARPMLGFGRRNPYETRIEATVEDETRTSYRTIPLAEVEWGYYVAAFEGTNARVHAFIEASTLTHSRLELGITILEAFGGVGLVSGSGLERVLEDTLNSDEPLMRLGATQLNELRVVYEKLQQHDDSRAGLRAAMVKYEQLDRIPVEAPLRFLGYVAIVESLLTHKPDPKDPYDSLTRQVRQKMLLLDRRFVHPLPYHLFGTDVSHPAIWTKLYDYRSSLAHGAEPDFGSKLQVLRGPTEAMRFVRAATVATMRQALEEPDLIADLRAC